MSSFTKGAGTVRCVVPGCLCTQLRVRDGGSTGSPTGCAKRMEKNGVQFFNLRLKMSGSLVGEPYRFLPIRSELEVAIFLLEV
ncbi:hypothetical protein [Sphingobacterium sp.]|uniref:hypothetical protein n=1 Tax=Sphingobacterium sp. TaxID=341027 RepID=UPI0028AD03F4|nr:hypothetical protein [Sphingobacterium sp.]